MAAVGTCTPLTDLNTGARSDASGKARSQASPSRGSRSPRPRSAGPRAAAGSGDWDWVEAAPFRAHLIWLIEASGVGRHAIAELTGVPARLVDRLLGPRSRPLRRLPPHFARQLLLLTPRSVAAFRANRVPADRVRRILLLLTRRGCGDSELALLTGLDTARVHRYRLGQLDLIDEYTEACVVGRTRAAGLEVEIAEALTVAA